MSPAPTALDDRQFSQPWSESEPLQPAQDRQRNGSPLIFTYRSKPMEWAFGLESKSDKCSPTRVSMRRSRSSHDLGRSKSSHDLGRADGVEARHGIEFTMNVEQQPPEEMQLQRASTAPWKMTPRVPAYQASSVPRGPEPVRKSSRSSHSEPEHGHEQQEGIGPSITPRASWPQVPSSTPQASSSSSGSRARFRDQFQAVQKVICGSLSIEGGFCRTAGPQLLMSAVEVALRNAIVNPIASDGLAEGLQVRVNLVAPTKEDEACFSYALQVQDLNDVEVALAALRLEVMLGGMRELFPALRRFLEESSNDGEFLGGLVRIKLQEPVLKKMSDEAVIKLLHPARPTDSFGEALTYWIGCTGVRSRS